MGMLRQQFGTECRARAVGRVALKVGRQKGMIKSYAGLTFVLNPRRSSSDAEVLQWKEIRLPAFWTLQSGRTTGIRRRGWGKLRQYVDDRLCIAKPYARW
jgi:hypothetical protein